MARKFGMGFFGGFVGSPKGYTPRPQTYFRWSLTCVLNQFRNKSSNTIKSTVDKLK